MDERDASLLNSFDFSAIEETDPSLTEGHRVIYERDVTFELRSQDLEVVARELGVLEQLRVKLLILGEDTHPLQVKIELTSDNDLFFHYVHCLDEAAFRCLQDTQQLLIDYSEYSTVLIRMLNSCIKEPMTFLATFTTYEGEHGQLTLIQNFEYKHIELLQLEFTASSEATVRQHITYRYNATKNKLCLLLNKLHDLNTVIAAKNPMLVVSGPN